MRWFVEVSRIGGSEAVDKYCIEANQWQAALQAARRLRGEYGPLSSFSIELLDDGYRAVDSTLRMRYIVERAPGDAPLSGQAEGAEGARSNGQAGPMSEAALTEPMAAPPTAAAPSARPAGVTVPPDEPPRRPPITPAPAAPDHLHPEVMVRPTVPSMVAVRLPDFQLVRKREQEPTAQTPIAYREYAYAVDPGTDGLAAEALLWVRFREVASSLESTNAGKFVQLAVFDHVFENKPARPPLATLVWKDWRGNPIVDFPARARASTRPQGRASAPPPAAEPAAAAAAPAAEAPVAAAPEPTPEPAPRRRKPGEDLISELFESVHELHFCADYVAGVDFVLGVLERTLPCEGILIHVFDIDANSFVVVRAKGPNAQSLLLHRTPDREPLFDDVMRRPGPYPIDAVAQDERFQVERWAALGVKPRVALCSGVKQGGRYLGFIELVNPAGGDAFYPSEVNALDYISEQLAEFLASRPIVLDADVVLPRG
jgi:hypothetical protein